MWTDPECAWVPDKSACTLEGTCSSTRPFTLPPPSCSYATLHVLPLAPFVVEPPVDFPREPFPIPLSSTLSDFGFNVHPPAHCRPLPPTSTTHTLDIQRRRTQASHFPPSTARALPQIRQGKRPPDWAQPVGQDSPDLKLELEIRAGTGQPAFTYVEYGILVRTSTYNTVPGVVGTIHPGKPTNRLTGPAQVGSSNPMGSEGPIKIWTCP